MTLPHALDPVRLATLGEPPSASRGGTAAERGRAVARRVLRSGAARVRPALVRFVEGQTAPVREQAQATAARLDAVEAELDALQAAQVERVLLRAEVEAARRDVARLQAELAALRAAGDPP